MNKHLTGALALGALLMAPTMSGCRDDEPRAPGFRDHLGSASESFEEARREMDEAREASEEVVEARQEVEAVRQRLATAQQEATRARAEAQAAAEQARSQAMTVARSEEPDSAQRRAQPVTRQESVSRLDGHLANATDDRLRVRAADGDSVVLDVPQGTRVYLDGQPTSPGAIPEGAEVRATYRLENGERQAVEIQARQQ